MSAQILNRLVPCGQLLPVHEASSQSQNSVLSKEPCVSLTPDRSSDDLQHLHFGRAAHSPAEGLILDLGFRVYRINVGFMKFGAGT